MKLSPIVGDTNQTDTEQQELPVRASRRRDIQFCIIVPSFPYTHSLLSARRNEDSKRWRILGPSLPPNLTFLTSHLRFLFVRSRPCLHLYFLASYSFLRRVKKPLKFMCTLGRFKAQAVERVVLGFSGPFLERFARDVMF